MAQENKKILNEELHKLPSVEKLLESGELDTEIERLSRTLVTRSVQEVLDSLRKKIRQGRKAPPQADILESIKADIAQKWCGFLTPVINATGVILHTNLGRAPLSKSAIEAGDSLLGGYAPIEFDLLKGERGHRVEQLERLLCILTGAESALVVNNNAAAVFLILTALAKDKEVIVSRGELVQIGGGFRLPEIMAQSGARLVEVGTTNQTYIADYENAVTAQTGMILKVHRSNFAIRGFSHEAELAELKALAKKKKLPLVYDIGSGALLNSEKYEIAHEPTIHEALKEGADIICFSGDKLLGGPQAGIILGRKKLLDRLRRHQMMRTIRIGRLTIVALEATLLDYLKKEDTAVPVWRMMAVGIKEIAARARKLASALGKAGIKAKVTNGRSMVGGGSLPDESLDTRLVAVKPPIAADEFAQKLRLADTPVIGRIQEGSFLIDLRTVLPSLDKKLLGVIRSAILEK